MIFCIPVQSHSSSLYPSAVSSARIAPGLRIRFDVCRAIADGCLEDKCALELEGRSWNQRNRDGCLLKLGIGPKLQHRYRIVEGL